MPLKCCTCPAAPRHRAPPTPHRLGELLLDLAAVAAEARIAPGHDHAIAAEGCEGTRGGLVAGRTPSGTRIGAKCWDPFRCGGVSWG